ncbi:MAG: glutamate 5-kinase [Marivibrio sp.]|uniref:glutamate 5-kinase n=1 Tax=Marivibrio sp. TaxID=2039719 RepID=UPI0032EBC598
MGAVETGAGAAKRIVVKIGSALLVDDATGAIRQDWLDALADDVAALKAQDREVLIVSSGSIAAGRRLLGLSRGALKLEEKQAAAATGQIRLAHAYQTALARRGVTVAQILVSPADTEERRRHLNARNTILQLCRLGAVPVINENDTVATAEIRYGDNDRLAARVATMVSADLLVLLSDIDGLYSADPRRDPTARHIPEVPAITPEILAMAGDVALSSEQGGLSTGGMKTKLDAARIAVAGGCAMAIAKGWDAHALSAFAAGGARATWFRPQTEPLTARKRWIAGALKPIGAITVDAGAAAALARGKSLLPAGALGLEGAFERGDPVRILGPDGAPLAKGLAAYSAEDAARILGRKTTEIGEILGYVGRAELVHADDLVLDGAPGRGARAGRAAVAPDGAESLE